MTSRVSAKGLVTIPKLIREGIGLKPGDFVVYQLQDGVAVLRKAERFDTVYHRALSATLSEWNSPADGQAFRGL
ncbi:MAG TPA: AbrB/MazE/SpoVT family DNA-binding domain-containing protein [Candidatus Methylomirabilis sp.]|nr:AbrB/MazE/SpoVT family DNA-binding domain-containing protein [Candidatus Methylomirabilis sp.]